MRDGLLDQHVPAALTRAGRLQLLREVAQALLEDRAPSREAALFVGSALSAWLQAGGPFEGHVRVGAPRGSHRTMRKLVDEMGLPSKG